MFKEAFILANIVAALLAAPSVSIQKQADGCDAEVCALPNCRCSSTETPGGLSRDDIPQLVFFTFDDAVTTVNFEYYRKAFFDRVNPNGCPVSTTYFVSHEYTDYTKVHELHALGHEIALHSISHKSLTHYWKDISVENITLEFGGEKELISYFANIPEEDMKGLRLPFLQMSGDTSFQGMSELGLLYDSSWPSLNFIDPALWPYTLDYSSTQDCPIGPCPVESHPGVWVNPMTDWIADDGTPCAMVDSCPVPEGAPAQFEFMKRNFERHYNGNRAPLGVYLHASWFALDPVHFEAYLMFVDYLNSLQDVYMVSVARGLEWMQNPQPISSLETVWPECRKTHEISCSPVTCQLDKEGEERYMTHCAGSCPRVYPWVGNPLGQ